ncbi:helix-turn-helix domain-containing protein [Halomonas sp. TRM85114]|uniref:RodZ domain-containing protein n=1 Tax=Halomonas jincaotanensis TaxID=2810616 RepID=UPI001BD3BCF2|nr:RodZ domain-containing protein [Halomonas jincaotanensis]MBS9403731.1 helix-turn-helix domain-containing protein [Halomonas jincaotanensis]
MSDTHFPEEATLSSPGEQLKRERANQGLTLEEVAAYLNLRPAVIQGLENDSYAETPVATYRRGYLRAYAHLLGIDDGPVLEAYRARFAMEDAEERKVTPVHITRPPSRLGAWLFRLVTLLVIAGLIGLTLMWWQSRGGNEVPDVSNNDPVSVDNMDGTAAITERDAPGVADDPDAPVAPAESGDGDSLPPLPQEESELGLVTTPEAEGEATSSDDETVASETLAADGEGASVTDEAASDETNAEGPGAAASGADSDTASADDSTTDDTSGDEGRVIELTFNEQSWTEVFDAGNERVFVGLQEPGTTARIEGEPPFRLTVGNATGVEMRWRGESMNLGPRAGANNVARFTLGE